MIQTNMVVFGGALKDFCILGGSEFRLRQEFAWGKMLGAPDTRRANTAWWMYRKSGWRRTILSRQNGAPAGYLGNTNRA